MLIDRVVGTIKSTTTRRTNEILVKVIVARWSEQ